MRIRWISLLVVTVMLGLPAPRVVAAPRHETAAERLHGKGVHCMDVIERDACAIEHFEALLEERTVERELMTDAMLRLIKLYTRAHDAEAIKDVLRQFWAVGMKRGSRGHVPYSTRFFPADMTIVVNVDTPRIIGAPVFQQTGDDLLQLAFTCDEAKRNDIRMKRRWNRAAKQAKREGRSTAEVIYAQDDREKRPSANQRRSQSEYAMHPPVFVEATCPLAKALGQNDVLGWRRMTGAMNHRDFRRSVAVAEIPDLNQKLAAAVEAGTLQPRGPDRWNLRGQKYFGEEIHVAMLDHEELTLATSAVLGGVITARAKNRSRMSRELTSLVQDIPRDTGFFFVMTEDAIAHLGMSGLKSSTRKFLQALLPRPKGLQVAGVFHDAVGLFTRMPTDNQVKGRLLVGLARRFIDGRSEKDAEAARWLANLDVAEAEDRRALLATYVLTGQQLGEFMGK